MWSGLSKEETLQFNHICEDYLRILDNFQTEVYNIRMIHHVLWREMRPLSIAIHHRAGSRAERQLHMLTPNGRNAIDYFFEVRDIDIQTTETVSSSIYFKTCTDGVGARKSYGIVCVPLSLKNVLMSHKQHQRIFRGAFQSVLDHAQNIAFLLPTIVKENVVRECGFEIKRVSQKKQSPGIIGEGAKNETHLVPCLKLTNWTQETMLWVTRNPTNPMFDSKWKQKIVNTVPLFVVPTGNRNSKTSDIEWRLSFIFVEKACFDRIAECKPKIRHLFGLVKFVFKCFLDELDMLSSYHLKTLMFWKCEKKTPEDWDNIQPLQFILEILGDMESCLEEKTIQHFFIPDCNIFPYENIHDDRVRELRKRFVTMKEEMVGMIRTTISFDLGVDELLDTKSWIQAIDRTLKIRTEQGVAEGYISGYLTRLHSMIFYSLLENHTKGTLQASVRALENILLHGTEPGLCDSNVQRIIPMIASHIKPLIRDVTSTSELCNIPKILSIESEDIDSITDVRTNIGAIDAFECYLRKDFVEAKNILDSVSPMVNRDRCIGLTLSKLHLADCLDHVLLFMMSHLQSSGITANRVYIEPDVMLTHLNIQLEFLNVRHDDEASTHPHVMDLLKQLYKLVSSSSVREPYIGTLSYKHIGTLMLMGYEDFLTKRYPTKTLCPFPEVPSDSFISYITKAQNFDLR